MLSNGSSQGGGSGSHGHGHGHHHHHHHFSRRAKIPKPTPEQVRYIKEVLHDIPAAEGMLGGSSTPAGSVPPGLRVARPPGSSGSVPSSAPTSEASSVDSARSSLAKLRIANGAADWQHTDLFECFRQFTAVEVLEGENSFACRNCWKWLNPDLEAKRREERAQKKSARERRREVRRAEREGREPRAVVNGNGNGLAHDDNDDDDDEMDPADRTARNTPAHSPKVVAAFSGLAEVPSMAPLSSGPPKVAPPPDAITGTPSQAPMRSFSMSSAATSNVTTGTSAASTSYDGGLSSDAFETTTDEEDNASQSLDDGASLSGSLGAAPVAAPAPAPAPTSSAAQDEPAVAPLGAEQLPLTTANVEKVAADPSLLVVPPSPAPLAAAAAGSATSGGGLTRAPPSPGATSGKSLASTKAPPPPAAKPPPKKQRHILRRAHKRYLISSDDLPPVLVIHLKRFMQTSKSSLFGAAFVNLKKRDDPVSFPKEMDLTPFLAPPGRPPRVNPNAFGSAPAPAPGGAEISKRSSWRSGLRHAHHPEAPTPSSSSSLSSRVDLEAGAPIELEKTAHNARYRLYAAVVHHGSLDTGHYASYVLSKRYGRGDEAGKGERRWVFCSDEDVTAVSEAEVLRSKAYMLCVSLSLSLSGSVGRTGADVSLSLSLGAGSTSASRPPPRAPTLLRLRPLRRQARTPRARRRRRCRCRRSARATSRCRRRRRPRCRYCRSGGARATEESSM